MTTISIADLFPEWEHTADVLNVLLVLLAAVYLVRRILNPTRLPQPLSVSLEDQFVTRREFERLDKRVSELNGRMETMQQQMTRQAEERAIKIHERLNTLLENIHEMKGSLDVLMKKGGGHR